MTVLDYFVRHHCLTSNIPGLLWKNMVLTTNILELVRFLGFDQINFHNSNCRNQNYFQNILPSTLLSYYLISKMMFHCLKSLQFGSSTIMSFQIDARFLIGQFKKRFDWLRMRATEHQFENSPDLPIEQNLQSF